MKALLLVAGLGVLVGLTVGCEHEADPLMDCYSDLETLHEIYAQAKTDLAQCEGEWVEPVDLLPFSEDDEEVDE